jgi:exopolysaccharide production protein ExoQ
LPLRLRSFHLLAFAGFVALPLAVLGAKMMPILVVAAAVAIVALERRALLSTMPWGTAALMTVLTAWGALTALWSIDPGRSIQLAAQVAGTGLAGLILWSAARGLDARGATAVGNGFVAGLLVALALLGFEILTGGMLTEFLRHSLQGPDTLFIYSVAFNRTTSVLAIFVWLAVLVLVPRRRPLAALGIVAATFFLLTRLENSSSVVALAIGAAVFLASSVNLKRTLRVVSVLIVAGGLASPFIATRITESESLAQVAANIPTSFLHRLIIWNFAGERSLERPFFGWGLDASRAMPGRATDMTAEINTLKPGSDNRGQGVRNDALQAMPLHPHNAMLQLWLEIGLPGAVMGLLGVLLALGRIAGLGLSRRHAAAVASLVVTAVVIALLSYGIWQVWWMATLWLGGAGLLALARAPGTPTAAGDARRSGLGATSS